MDDIEKLIQEYRDFAIKHTEYSEKGDYKTVNKSYSKIMKVLKKLITLKEDDKLLQLLNDDNPGVRCWAATNCLEIKESEALKTLEALEKGHYPEASFNAKYVIQEWKKGNLKFRETN